MPVPKFHLKNHEKWSRLSRWRSSDGTKSKETISQSSADFDGRRTPFFLMVLVTGCSRLEYVSHFFLEEQAKCADEAAPPATN